jgi:hypothetical protein
MTPFRYALFATLILLAPAAARACVLTTHGHVEPFRTEGTACAVTVLHDDAAETRMGEAQDLGGGFVAQRLFDGVACGGEISVIVQDCRTGQAVAFGGSDYEGANTQYDRMQALLDEVADRAPRSDLLSIEEIEDAARDSDIEFVVRMRTQSQFDLGGQSFHLGCGCQLHYPDLPGSQP